MAAILVFNPNSNRTVTEKMADAVAGMAPPGVELVCETFADGPFGIETQDHIDAVAGPVRDRIAAGQEDAFVIACYSDPGLSEARKATTAPVFGIQESAIAEAVAEDGLFGVIALSAASKARHLAYIEQLGQTDRLAGEQVADLSVAESAGGDATFTKLVEAGTALRDQDGAARVILGCAGMARHRRPLENEIGLPVIDPVQAAVRRAIAARSA